MGRISIIIPALNEENGIERAISAIPKDEIERMGYEVQILVVDNGSDDSTGELAARAGAEVIIEPERGYGKAYKAGFARAQGEIIATADADHTYPIEDIPRLLRILEEENLDFITTDRFTYMEDGAMSLSNRFGNAVLNLAVRVLFRLNLKDSQSGMWLFRRELLDRMVLRANSMAFSEEIKLEACYFIKSRWKEVPIRYRARLGKSKLRKWRDGLGNLCYLIKKRFIR